MMKSSQSQSGLRPRVYPNIHYPSPRTFLIQCYPTGQPARVKITCIRQVFASTGMDRSSFHGKVVRHYNTDRCFITGTNLAVAAAHLVPHAAVKGEEIDTDPANGILLRKDWHFLFDSGEWTIVQTGPGLTVQLGSRMQADPLYCDYQGTLIGAIVGVQINPTLALGASQANHLARRFQRAVNDFLGGHQVDPEVFDEIARRIRLLDRLV
jgi:hypothetical protein